MLSLMKRDTSHNDRSCYSQYGDHTIDKAQTWQQAHARRQTGHYWRHLVTRGGYGLRASPEDPTSNLRSLGWHG